MIEITEKQKEIFKEYVQNPDKTFRDIANDKDKDVSTISAHYHSVKSKINEVEELKEEINSEGIEI